MMELGVAIAVVALGAVLAFEGRTRWLVMSSAWDGKHHLRTHTSVSDPRLEHVPPR